MQFTFRGVRGSIASPGPSTVRYGGNTTCIEIRGDEGELIILDAGTGIFPLAQSLMPELPIEGHIFISHTHWDHIQGLPFFTPLFIPGNHITIYGAGDPVSQRGIAEVLNRQMDYAYFPIREAELNAQIDYVNLPDMHRVEIGSVVVENILMNHPAMDYGYKVTCGGKSVFFTGDHEWQTNIFEPDDRDFDEFDQPLYLLNKLEEEGFFQTAYAHYQELIQNAPDVSLYKKLFASFLVRMDAIEEAKTQIVE